MEFVTVRNGSIDLNVAVAGEGPLILCIHGWPELWYAWRYQIAHFSKLGFKVAALDVRGYGGSSKPYEIASYSMLNLASDVAAVVDQIGGGQAILFGHEWGAPIAWNSSLLYPEKIRAVAGLSVPYTPRGEASMIELARILYDGRFFYHLYFYPEGVAEKELEADIPMALRKIYFALSGQADLKLWGENKKPGARLLDGLVDPDPLPSWMSEADLQVYVNAFRAGGFRGPLNRFRAQTGDIAEMAAYAGKPVTQPSCFIAGERDVVRTFLSGVDLFKNPGVGCSDFRGATILPGIGHWAHLEAADATNAALTAFVKSL